MPKITYEALTGKSLIDGSALDATSRTFAALGAATGGGSTVAKHMMEGLINVYHAMHTQ